MASLQRVDSDVPDWRDQIVGPASTDVFGSVVVKILRTEAVGPEGTVRSSMLCSSKEGIEQ